MKGSAIDLRPMFFQIADGPTSCHTFSTIILGISAHLTSILG